MSSSQTKSTHLHRVEWEGADGNRRLANNRFDTQSPFWPRRERVENQLKLSRANLAEIGQGKIGNV